MSTFLGAISEKNMNGQCEWQCEWKYGWMAMVWRDWNHTCQVCVVLVSIFPVLWLDSAREPSVLSSSKVRPLLQ
jgi:hypothetical protein